MNKTADYPDWHQPSNEECPHNQNPEERCKCKRPRIYKPYRVVRMRDADAPHGINSRLILHAWPNGVIELREHGRRKSYSIYAGELYKRLVWSAVLSARAKKRAEKAARKKNGKR